MPRAGKWIWAALAWIGIIFFSSTSLASQWAESSFSLVSGVLLRRLKEDSASYSLVHLLADKGFHISLFCVLAMLLWLALGPAEKKAWIILISGAVVGSLSEFLQRFFPDRDPAFRDVLINTAGTALGLGICYAVAKVAGAPRWVRSLQPAMRATSSSPK
jgi:VanZ family protein